ncbi:MULTISPECIES: bacteriophage abortive infection AbiH family protein [unclassified Microbacterium]|uniref:bacteriophage abortive infection AbiH family protein n=1 Tax=unclassified Microbacterium TaxID=2609290 RepID=UPI00049340BB|nr:MULTISPECIES: bacteriophage abortive infection AbiH family protein [unclassified Microbacterium]
MSTLYVLGNGFDLNHELPTRYDPDLKNLAIQVERFPGEWESYSFDADLWSSVEQLLAHPDVDIILDHLGNYSPDLSSDRESDRDSVIHEAEQLLEFPLEEFAEKADQKLETTKPEAKFVRLFRPDDYFLTFNYTHTLEWLYGVPSSHILHLHGEVGVSQLIIGYEPGALQGIASLDQWDDEANYEHYRSRAYDAVKRRLAEFEKVYQHEALNDFVDRIPHAPERIVVFGHSLGSVDRPYFKSLAGLFPDAQWTIYAHREGAFEIIRAAMDDYGLDVPYDIHVLR